jgi:hypothetical protein
MPGKEVMHHSHRNETTQRSFNNLYVPSYSDEQRAPQRTYDQTTCDANVYQQTAAYTHG